MVNLGVPGAATTVSRDGAIVAGAFRVPPIDRHGLSPTNPFWWSAASGIRALVVRDGAPTYGFVTAMSTDGAVLLGQEYGQYPSRPFRWAPSSGELTWLDVPDDVERGPFLPSAITADATAAFGYGPVHPGDSTAVRWDEKGMSALPAVEGRSDCEVSDVSADGAIVIGSCSERVGTPNEYRDVYSGVAEARTIPAGQCPSDRSAA